MINTYAIGISVLLNIILNLFWIPKWGINGAALATSVSYTVMFLVTIVVYIKISGNKIKDIILIKKEDFIFYKDLLFSIKAKLIKWNVLSRVERGSTSTFFHWITVCKA